MINNSDLDRLCIALALAAAAWWERGENESPSTAGTVKGPVEENRRASETLVATV